MISSDTQVKSIFRHPKVRKNDVFIVFVLRREHQHKGCNVRCRRKVKTAIADTPFQFILVHRKCTGIPFFHRHPTNSLLDPLVQTKLPEGILLAGILLCRVAGSFNFINANCDIQARIGFSPHLGVCPIVRIICTVDHRIKSRIDFTAVQDVLCFLVGFIADAVGICSGCRNQEVQRLHSCIAGALGHDIKELSIGLCVQFIEDHAMNIEAVLGVGFCGKHLVEAVGRCINNAFL